MRMHHGHSLLCDSVSTVAGKGKTNRGHFLPGSETWGGSAMMVDYLSLPTMSEPERRRLDFQVTG